MKIEDISIEFSPTGEYRIVFPDEPMTADKLVALLRKIADNVEKLDREAGD